MEDDTTTIRVKNSTKDRLGTFGTTNDSFDDTINKVLDELEKCRK